MIPYWLYESLCRRGQTRRSAPTDDRAVVGANLRVRPLYEDGVMVRAAVGANLRVRPLRVRPIPLSRIVPL